MRRWPGLLGAKVRALGHRGNQSGQSIVLLALVFVGLAAFAGLVVDAGMVFVSYGHLRRTADAAALAAATQFKANHQWNEVYRAAGEFVRLHNIQPADTMVQICGMSYPAPGPGDPDPHDSTLCTSPQRKIARVVVKQNLSTTFLRLVGWDTITLSANSEAEAASLDLALVLDTSESMSYDTTCAPGQDRSTCIAACNANDTCAPFNQVRSAAQSFVTHLFFPYDRVSVIHFDRYTWTLQRLSTSQATVLQALQPSTLAVSPVYYSWTCDPNDPGQPDPPVFDPRPCESTNIGGALERADGELMGSNYRDKALQVIILLTDGAANMTDPNPNDSNEPYCPPETRNNYSPQRGYCRDVNANSFHAPVGSANFDADDFAYFWALGVGSKQDMNSDGRPDGDGIVIFTIGLGDAVISPNKDMYGRTGQQQTPPVPNATGETLLRHIAAVGDDGDPSTDPCNGVAAATNCGNYYYAVSGSDLQPIFDSIASRIFTRITH